MADHLLSNRPVLRGAACDFLGTKLCRLGGRLLNGRMPQMEKGLVSLGPNFALWQTVC